jgi:hypothetical protein
MRLRLGPQADSERVPLLSIALVNCTIGTLGPTVELFNENGNVVHPRWHSQPNDSESELSDALHGSFTSPQNCRMVSHLGPSHTGPKVSPVFVKKKRFHESKHSSRTLIVRVDGTSDLNPSLSLQIRCSSFGMESQISRQRSKTFAPELRETLHLCSTLLM